MYCNSVSGKKCLVLSSLEIINQLSVTFSNADFTQKRKVLYNGCSFFLTLRQGYTFLYPVLISVPKMLFLCSLIYFFCRNA